MSTFANTSILAGNSRLNIANDGTVEIDAQLRAFEAGIRLADHIRNLTGTLPAVSIAFDHKGVFRKQFLRDGLTNRQKRNPKLSQLRNCIVEVFEGVAAMYNVSVSDVFVIHEDSAKFHAAHLVEHANLQPDIIRRVTKEQIVDSASITSSCSLLSGGISCAAITTEYFRKAFQRPCGQDDGTSSLLEVFFEESPWSTISVYSRGLQLAHLVGINCAMRLNMVAEDGGIRSGMAIQPVTRPDIL